MPISALADQINLVIAGIFLAGICFGVNASGALVALLTIYRAKRDGEPVSKTSSAVRMTVIGTAGAIMSLVCIWALMNLAAAALLQ